MALAVLLAALCLWEVAVLPSDGFMVTDAALGLGYLSVPALGALMVRTDRHSRGGWVFLLGGTGYLFKNTFNTYANAAFLHHAHLPAAAWLGWLSQWGTRGQIAVVTAGVLLFPDDRLPGPRWRRVWPLFWFVEIALSTDLLGTELWHWDVRNPAGLPEPWGDIASAPALLALLLAPVLFLLCARCLQLKGRLQQDAPWADGIRVVAWCAWLVAAAQCSCLVFSGGSPVYAAEHISAVGLALGAWYCVVRYRLFDLRLLVNRTLVYSVLSGCVGLGYMLLVAGARAVTPGRVPSAAVLILAGLAALPLRDLVQRRVNMLLYGHAADPYQALGSIGGLLATAADSQIALSAVTEAVARAMRACYVAVEADGMPLAQYGILPPASPLIVLPLRFGGTDVARLTVVTTRGRLSAAERRLLDRIAGPVAAAAHGLCAEAALREARERMAQLREDERLRIRRDLHDGLGPTLAGIVLGLEQARIRVSSHPAVAASTLAQLSDYAQAAVTDVRRLVHDLRPVALDERGLPAALAQEAERLGAVIVTDPELPQLPSVVEIAIWRIALEALTNAQRHANASRIEVTLECRGSDLVELAVSDDGDGLASSASPGIGIRSMHDRARRIGGTLTVASRLPHGTLVRACLPLPAAPG